MCKESKIRPSGAPTRCPSKLPDADNLKLSCSIGDSVGNGISSVVFEAKDVTLSDSKSDVHLPPLVLKVARRWKSNSLLQEAWAYDEMEPIQGVALARCYGLFQVDLPRNAEPHPWDAKFYQEGQTEEIGFACDLTRNEYKRSHPALKEFVYHPDRLCVLVLERLGDELPSDLDELSREEKKKIIDLYREIAHFSIIDPEQVNVHNILRAPTNGLASLPSPTTQKIHNWRLIDFAKATKTSHTEEATYKNYWPSVAAVLGYKVSIR
ncbi:hypothetical protein EWM64_g8471 [Hericium alpestre]|uniref:Protein kinase domain-containing protein n=1 Tax=Hericium alpestre TaxID=135208 RepID=A0A4Y9ZL96_9AGAM|nr:hypothetical protein EWM64_g8471 [Hericium alpestre]